MEYGSIVWLGCGALAVIFALLIQGKKSEKKIEVMREPIDFKVEFFGTRTGWHGHFCQGTLKNGVLVGILSGDSLKPHDVVRGFVEGREEGLWQVVPLKLSHLEEGYILVVGERDRDGLTQCLYPNAHGIALVGWVKAGAQAPLEKNKKYLAHKGESGYFILD